MAHNRGTKSQHHSTRSHWYGAYSLQKGISRVLGSKVRRSSTAVFRSVHAGDTKQWNRLCAASGASLLFLCGNDECAPSRGFLLPKWDHANSDQSSWVVSERVRRRREGTEMLNQRALY